MSVLVHKNNCMRALVHMHDQVTSLTWLHVRFIFIHLFYPYLYLFLPDIPIRLQLLISHWLICWPWQKIAWWSQASICRSGILLLSPSWGPPYLISKFSRAWEGFRSSQQAQALYAAWLVDLNWPGPRHGVICSVPFPSPAFSLLHVADETRVQKRDMKNHSVFYCLEKLCRVIPLPLIILRSPVLRASSWLD